MPTRYVTPYAREFADDGLEVGAGYKLNFYAAGTTTRQDTYSDIEYATANENPVVADSDGRFPDIWMVGSYKVILTDADGVQIWSADNVSGVGGSGDAGVFATAQDLRDFGYASWATSAKTLGAATDNDNGGGSWRWDASSTDDDTTGLVLLPTGHVGPGRWVRNFSGPVNVAWFGIGTDIGAAANAAIAATSGPVTLYIPPGTHPQLTAITLPSNRPVSVIGDGYTDTIIKAGADLEYQMGFIDPSAVAADRQENEVYRGFCLDGQFRCGNNFRKSHGYRFAFEMVHFQRATAANIQLGEPEYVGVSGSANAGTPYLINVRLNNDDYDDFGGELDRPPYALLCYNTWDGQIINGTFSRYRTAGISFNQCSTMQISQLHFSAGWTQVGIEFIDSHDILTTGCQFDTVQYGITVDATSDDLQIISNNFFSNTNTTNSGQPITGVFVQGTKKALTIVNNQWKRIAVDIELDDGAEITGNSTVLGNFSTDRHHPYFQYDFFPQRIGIQGGLSISSKDRENPSGNNKTPIHCDLLMETDISGVAYGEGTATGRAMIDIRRAGLKRWQMGMKEQEETGGNAGSYFEIGYYTDAGDGFRPFLRAYRDGTDAYFSDPIKVDTPTGEDAYLYIRPEYGQTPPALGVYRDDNGATIAQITSTGNVQGTGAYTDLSDEQVKEDIQALPFGLDTIMALQPRQYRRIQSSGDGVRDQLKAKRAKAQKMPMECGFVAQELQAVMPEAVVPFADGLLGIQSGQIIPVLVRAVQELSERLGDFEKGKNQAP